MTPAIDSKSTGPRTPEGKAISARNGETHGFTSIRISPKNAEGQAILHVKHEGLAASLKPSNFLEQELVDAMATAATKKHLIEHAQAQLESEAQSESRLYDNLHRYWKDADRAFHRALTAFQVLRRDQARENHQQFREEMNLGVVKGKIAKNLQNQEKALREIGSSLFDGPNPQRAFDLRLQELFAKLPTPAHRRKSEKQTAN